LPSKLSGAGEICKSKDGTKNYIRVIKDFAALRGNNISLVKYEDYLQKLVDLNRMKPEEKEDKLNRITWVKYVLHVPPQEKKEEDPYESKNGWINDAIELRESKAGNLYLYVAHDFEVQKDSTIQLQKFSDRIKSLLDNNFINEEQFKKKQDVAKWLHFVGSIPPQN
jgi:hypothetical protein